MLRFKVRDLAVCAVSAYPQHDGAVVEIESVGPFPSGYIFSDGTRSSNACDYTVLMNGYSFSALDHLLRKIDPTDEPASLTRHAEDECTA